MTWPITSWITDGEDWASAANILAFLGAIRERQTVCGLALTPLKVVGDDVGAASWFASMQAAVEELCSYFVVSGAAGAPFAVGYYDGKTTRPVYDLATLFEAAGLPGFTWRAYIDHPVHEAGVDQARQVAVGDIIGPWVFEDLQKALKALRWTAASLSSEDQTSESIEVSAFATDNPATWANAQGNAETAYAAADPVPDNSIAEAYSSGIKQGGPSYTAWLNRRRTKIGVSGLSTAYAHAVEFYLKAAATGVFDANGDDVIEGAWSLIDTVGPTTDASVESGWLGSLDQPAWCDAPIGDPGYSLGWTESYRDALIRWDVAGGFEYV